MPTRVRPATPTFTQWFINVLKTPYFEYVVLPFGATLLTAYVKYRSKSPRYREFSEQEFAVGPDLLITALVALIAYSLLLVKGEGHAPQDVVDSKLFVGGVLSVACVLGLLLLTDLVSAKGWRDEYTLNRVGIYAPLAAGILSLYALCRLIGD